MSLPAPASPIDVQHTPRRAPRKGWWRWLAVVGYMTAIFFASSQSALPTLPGNPSDKLEHFGAYAVLGALLIWAQAAGRWQRVTPQTVLIAILVSSAYGYSDECHQLFVPNRSFDLWDWAADTAGAALAAAVAWAWSILLRGRGRIHDV